MNVKIVNIVQKMTSRLAGPNSAEETIPVTGATTTTEWYTKMTPAKTVKNDVERSYYCGVFTAASVYSAIFRRKQIWA